MLCFVRETWWRHRGQDSRKREKQRNGDGREKCVSAPWLASRRSLDVIFSRGRIDVILYLLHRDFVSLLLASLRCLWVTASSSLRHNNVVVNGKQRPDTLSQVLLHKKGERKKNSETFEERRGLAGERQALSLTSYLKVPYYTTFTSPMFS